MPSRLRVPPPRARFRSNQRRLSTVGNRNCDIPATGSNDYGIGAAIALALPNPFSYLGLLIESGTMSRGAPESGKKGAAMAKRGIAFVLAGLLLGGCMQGTLEQASEANFTARDRKLLANAPYARANIPLAYQRTIVA